MNVWPWDIFYMKSDPDIDPDIDIPDEDDLKCDLEIQKAMEIIRKTDMKFLTMDDEEFKEV